MLKYATFLIFTISLLVTSSQSFANHCSGGHKEIKDTKDTTTEDKKDSKSN